MPAPRPEPGPSTDTAALFAGYLDFYRAAIEAKLRGLSPEQLRQVLVPSGWTPLEMLTHLVHMERRWFVWGVLGEDVAAPWGDKAGGRADAPWAVTDADTLDDLLERLHSGGRRTSEILATTPLDALAPPGPRFDADSFPGGTAPVLWVAFHVLQEYARHAGHLDIVRELLDGTTGKN